MKKLCAMWVFLPLLSLSICLAGCRKELTKVSKPQGSEERTYQLNINVSNFSHVITDLPSGTAKLAAAPPVSGENLRGVVKYLYLYVFKVKVGDTGRPDYLFVDSVSQDTSDENFGNCSLKIPVGDYEVSVFGSPVPLKLEGTGTPFAIQYENDDLFVGWVDFGAYGQGSNYPVTLGRQVAKLEVQIEDALPEFTSRIELTIQNEAHSFALSSGDAYGEYVGSLYDKLVQKEVLPDFYFKNNFTIDSYVLSTEDQYNFRFPEQSDLTIRAYIDSNIIAEKKVPKLLHLLHRNKKTTLRGKLFDKGENFTVAVDSVWAGRDTVPF